MAVTPEQIAALEAEIASLNQSITDGVRIVVLPGGQSTTYQTTESLIKARDDAENRLKALRDLYAFEQGDTAVFRPRQTLLSYGGRGYD